MEPPITIGMTLSPMQQLFVHEYLVDLNATQAAIRAGYSPATAYSQGQRLLKNVEIEKNIQDAMDRRAERTGITADRVLQELAAIGFSSMGDYLTTEYGFPTVNIENLTRNQMAAIRDIKIERDSEGRRKIQVKLADKLTALIVMGRHLDRVTAAAGQSGPVDAEGQMPRLANTRPDREGPNPLPTTAMTWRRGGAG